MKIEQQVSSIEQSQKLKELGIVQNSFFYYTVCPTTLITTYEYSDRHAQLPIKDTSLCSAYTVAELGNALTTWLDDDNNRTPDFINEKYGLNLSQIFNPLMLTDLLIYLLENNHITAEQVNQRLNS